MIRRAAALMAILALAMLPLRSPAACPMDDSPAAEHGSHHDVGNHDDAPSQDHSDGAACQGLAGCATVAHLAAAVRVLPVMERHTAIAATRLPLVDGPATSLEPPPPKS